MNDCTEWLWGRDRCGYGVVSYQGKLRKAHRVAYCLDNNLLLSDIEGLVVRHKCDNPGCVNPDHLELGTHADNERDKDSRGRRPRGADSGTAKLTDEDILEIRSLYKRYSKSSGSVELAKKFGVHGSTIRLIISGKTWGHVCQ